MIFISPHIKDCEWDSGVVGSHVDLWPTLADVCNIPVDPRLQGHSLMDKQLPGRAYFFRPGALGIREGAYKYIWNYLAGHEDLFDLASDPKESTNIAAEHPELCQTLLRRLRAWTEFQSKWTASEAAHKPADLN